MKYPNAFSGVKKLHIAAILDAITTILLIVAGVAAFALYFASNNGSDAATIDAFGITTLATGLPAALLAIVASILNFIGLFQASKDEPKFKIAFYLSIATLVVSIASGFFETSGSATLSIFEMVYDILTLAVMAASIEGIRELGKTLHRASIVSRSNTIVWIYLVSLIAEGVTKLVTTGMVYNIASAVSIIFALVAFIKYIKLLGKTKTALEVA